MTVSATGPLTLGFLSPHNAYDRCAFSGTVYFAAKALQRHPDISVRMLGGHKRPSRLDRFLGRKTPAPDADLMDLDGLDAVIGMVATPLLDQIAQTRPDLPFVHVTDATPAFLREAYGWGIPAATEALEARVAVKAGVTVYSSDIMARRAPEDLGERHLAAAAVPFGVNFDQTPAQCPIKPSLNKVNLLFVGLDWTRKGGDIAVAALDQLRAAGHPAELTIVGRCPDRHRTHPAIRSVGFLNKAKPRDQDHLARLYQDAHLLLLPSRGDCTPMVVAEAMAHGTPVLATDTGGIGTQIARTGRVLPLHTEPRRWAETIRDMTADQDGYQHLSDAAFDRANQVFSWDNWAKEIVALTQSALAGHERPQLAVAG